MRSWTNEPDLRQLANLRMTRPMEVSGMEAHRRQEARRLVADTPEARLGMVVADMAMENQQPLSDAHIARMVPAAQHARLPGTHPAPSLRSRFRGDIARKERSQALDDRWSAIAQVTAGGTRRWIATGTTPGIDDGHGIGNLLKREIRAAAAGQLASGSPPIDQSKMLHQQMDELAAPTMKRVALFLSEGPDIGDAVERGANGSAGSGGHAAAIATSMRRAMAAARIGALDPRQIVEAARSDKFSALDDLTPGQRPITLPAYGRTYASAAEREQAIDQEIASKRETLPGPQQEKHGKAISQARALRMGTDRGIT